MVQLFNTDEAALLGIRGAIFVMQFRYWILKNKADGRHLHEGRTWTYNSLSGLERYFYYLSKKQIRSAVDDLVTRGILLRGNFNIHGYDRTTWYAFVNEAVDIDDWKTLIGPKRQMDVPKRANASAPGGTTIPTVSTHKESTMSLFFETYRPALCKVMNRQLRTNWSKDEMKSFEAMCPIDNEELAMVGRYYEGERKKDKNILRTAMLTLLRHWPTEVDRAREWCRRHPLSAARTFRPKEQPTTTPPASDEQRQAIAAKLREARSKWFRAPANGDKENP